MFDRWKHFEEVAYHCVVSFDYHVRGRVDVDGEDLLRRLRSHPVLDRYADAAGDVELRRNAGACLADLIAVRTPTVVRDRTTTSDNATEALCQCFKHLETFSRADTSTATDHHRCGCQRQALGQDYTILNH